MLQTDRQGQIDLTYLREMSDNDEGFIKTMLESFLTNVPEIAANVREYHSQEKWQELAQEIHKLKPTLKYLGVNSLNELMPMTEENCKAQTNFEQINEGVQQITDMADKVLIEAQELISN